MVDEPIAKEADNGEGSEIMTLRKALKELSTKDRTLLAMHYLEEIPIREIAEVFQLPEGTIKSRLFHARQRLKRSIKST